MQCHDNASHSKKPDKKACCMKRPFVYWAAGITPA